ncbi:Transcriptional regulatory protein, C terminal [Tenacibaculum sp. MAR_2009_124]|uniref:winged helix-turn-helix domain-containing protein n=1 Tax=Tenacibaculum sp. MAR_2009_124 TaxID=1250059 RepID=UPI0008959F92|nr:winged helix-turn-helix domain-containing protein [Tenacibaculum sp. MAR_2009_124]SEC42195.1 Transcriptional regulatory protein, C terminal [Tenacibaculum sp. MAR_2009_124]
MSSKRFYIYGSLGILLFLGGVFSSFNQDNSDFIERVKIGLREVGNNLLLSNKDSTSLVLPVKEIKPNIYEVSFEKGLEIEPGFLVSEIKKSFKKSDLSKFYRVAVLECLINDVVYSYEMKETSKKSIVPCSGRVLPVNCYKIQVKFIASSPKLLRSSFYWFGFLVVLLLILSEMYFGKRKNSNEQQENPSKIQIGNYWLYPNQSKLVFNSDEIMLSNKEREILTVFASAQNEIIKREELSKKVWEDNGVFVGRSLDTYISKLRKKLKEDPALKIINVHGVGYKLEVSKS